MTVVQHRTNWGRWGDHDERGALNVITDEKRRAAAAAVTRGRMYSLAHSVGRETPHTPGRNPVWHTGVVHHNRKTGRGSADDVLTMHSHIGTHMDALCHYWGADGLYNGHNHEDIASDGAPHLSIDKVVGIATRALLVDVADVCHADKQGWGQELGRDLLEQRLSGAGLTLEPGDAVLIHTGWSRLIAEQFDVYSWGEPGIGLDAAEWLAENDVAVVGCDNWAVEVVPPPVKGEGLMVHRALLNRYGIYILENLVLSEVAKTEGTCSGMLVVAPLLIQGGAGSPINPLFLR